jgi:hypothetical protein
MNMALNHSEIAGIGDYGAGFLANATHSARRAANKNGKVKQASLTVAGRRSAW